MGVRITAQSLWPKSNASSFVYEFAQSRIIIGRSRSADVQLPHAAVSAIHASIREQGAGYVLVDEGSTNGTRVNEAPLAPGRPKALRPNDLVDIGGFRLTIEVGVPVSQTVSARRTTEFARQMLREQVDANSPSELHARLASIQSGADEPVDLLPLPKEAERETTPPRDSRPNRPRSSQADPVSFPTTPVRFGRSEMAVYTLATLVVVTSVIAMALLMRS